MGTNVKGRKHPRKLSWQPSRDLVGLYAGNEWREFVRETSAAKFYAIGFCVLCFGVALGIVTSLILGDQRNLRLANLVLPSGGFSVICKLKRWIMGRRKLPIK